MVDELLSDMRERMEQSIKALQNDFDTIRTGRANSALVERMPVECYGAFSPLVQIASISVPDAQAILIRPYNPDDLTAIERAISTSELGINPQNDGKQIRLLIPPLTEERRRDLRAAAERYAKLVGPGPSAVEHGDFLYDERGLPR